MKIPNAAFTESFSNRLVVLGCGTLCDENNKPKSIA